MYIFMCHKSIRSAVILLNDSGTFSAFMQPSCWAWKNTEMLAVTVFLSGSWALDTFICMVWVHRMLMSRGIEEIKMFPTKEKKKDSECLKTVLKTCCFNADREGSRGNLKHYL